MDETTGKGTFKLPRRLPKLPNQLFLTGEAEPVAKAPLLPREIAEESLPVFEMGPELPDFAWQELPPQEFTVPDEEPYKAFYAQDVPFPPAREFSTQEEHPSQPQQFAAQDEQLMDRQESLLPKAVPTPLREVDAPFARPAPRPSAWVEPPPHPQQPPLKPVPPAPSVESEKPSVVPVGDPKPAFARPAGRSRSRPAAPSGSFPAIRQSDEVAISASSRSTFIGDDQDGSRELASESVSVADTTPRFSGQVSSADDAAPETSSLRTTKSAHRRRTSASTVPALIVLSIFLVGYSFAVGPIESYLESQLIGSAGASSTLLSLVPWVALLPVVLLLGGVLWIIAGLIGLRHVKQRTRKSRTEKKAPRRRLKKERRKSPLEQFREEAAKEEIDGTTAYQAWRLLQPFGPDSHVLSIYDELENTLGLRPKDIQSIYQQLTPQQLHGERFRLRTVLDLLRIVKQASLAKS